MSSYSKDLVHMVVENFGYLHRQHLPMVIFNPFFFPSCFWPLSFLGMLDSLYLTAYKLLCLFLEIFFNPYYSRSMGKD